jgi:hypothetical protein
MTRVVVLSLSTDRNVGTDNFEHTLKQFGYEYYILGRGDKFKGWRWRTAMYMQKIRETMRSKDDLYFCVDSNDVLVAGPPEEAAQKFRSLGSRAVIGGEPACCTGSYDDPDDVSKRRNVGRRLRAIMPDSRWIVPNGGSVSGYADTLLEVLEMNKDNVDDQEGYLNTLLAGQNKFTVDHTQTVFACIPRLHGDWRMEGDKPMHQNKEITAYWKIQNKRLVNRTYGTSPIFLHFSGRFWYAYTEVVKKLFPTEPDQPVPRIVADSVATAKALSVGKKKGLFSSILWIVLLVVAVLVITGGGVTIAIAHKKKQS